MAHDSVNKFIFGKIISSKLFGWTPLLKSARVGDALMVEKLLKDNCNNFEVNRYGLSVLTVAVSSKKEQIVQTVLRSPRFKYNPEEQELIDPVSLACYLGLKNILLILLEELPFLINNIVPFSNYSPIFFAVIGKHLEIIEILIEKGANLHLKNSASQTALDVANMMNNNELTECLVSGMLEKKRFSSPLHTNIPQAYVGTPHPLYHPKFHYSSPSKSDSHPYLKSPYQCSRTPSQDKVCLYVNTPILSSKFPANSSTPQSFSRFLKREQDPHVSNQKSHGKVCKKFNFNGFSTPQNANYCHNISNCCPTPRVLSSAYMPPPQCKSLNSTSVYSISPNFLSPSCSYHHFSSPHCTDSPESNHASSLDFNQQWCHQSSDFNSMSQFKSPSPHCGSFIDSLATPMKFRAKKPTLRFRLLNKIYKRKSASRSNENDQNILHLKEQNISDVLEGLGLQNFKLFFELNEIEPSFLTTCTDDDLKSMGIQDKKSRKLILKKLKKLS